MNTFCFILCATMVDGSVSKEFMVKKPFEQVADHIEQDRDDMYEALGVKVIERKADGTVHASADTQMGHIEWTHSEKVERTDDEIIVTINAHNDKYTFSATLRAKPFKKVTKVIINAHLSVDHPKVQPAHIHMGLNKVIDKIRKYMKKMSV